MSETKITIDLLDPVTGFHGDPVIKVVLREPLMGDLFDIGDPVTIVNRDGLSLTVENERVLKSYLDRLLIEPTVPGILNKLSCADGLRVKEALHRFFIEARARAYSTLSDS